MSMIINMILVTIIGISLGTNSEEVVTMDTTIISNEEQVMVNDFQEFVDAENLGEMVFDIDVKDEGNIYKIVDEYYDCVLELKYKGENYEEHLVYKNGKRIGCTVVNLMTGEVYDSKDFGNMLANDLNK